MASGVTRSIVTACIASAFLFACGRGEESPAPEAQASPTRDATLAADPRLALLLEPCVRDTTYDADTSDFVPVLVEAVLHGDRDALHSAKRELAASGRPGLEAAERILRRYWNDLAGVGHMRNALEIVALSDEAGARALALEALEHPLEALRLLALEALGRHGRAQDYGAVRAALDQSSPEFRARFALLLHRLDPARAGLEFARWSRTGEEPALFEVVAPLLAGSEDAATIELCRELWPAARPAHRAWLAAPCARAGDAAALELLRGEQRHDEPQVRGRAVRALVAAGLADELPWTLREDPSPELRLFAIGTLAAPGAIDEHRSALVAALSDPSEMVSSACLEALAAAGDPAALDRAKLLLADPRPGALELGLRALRAPMRSDEPLARAVLESLRARLEHEGDRAPSEQASLLQAIGQVPLGDAARLLLGRARTAAGLVNGIDARRWIVLQAGSAGEPGQREVLLALAGERDPRARLDLIEGVATLGNELARTALLELAESEASSPYEILLASERLVRIGPGQVVAPVLKRVALRVLQPDVRVALQCLLWRWYPAPRER